MKTKNCTFNLRCVHPDEVLDIISSLKSTQSCGIDNIASMVLKLAKHQLIPVITHIINLSIQSAVFPNFWKVAKVIPLHKKGEVYDPKNYRAVSLLPVLFKILERVVFVK